MAQAKIENRTKNNPWFLSKMVSIGGDAAGQARQVGKHRKRSKRSSSSNCSSPELRASQGAVRRELRKITSLAL